VCVCVVSSFYSLLLDVKGSFLLTWRILVVVVVATLFFEKRILELFFLDNSIDQKLLGKFQ
jgi:uncharacterized membrane protein